MKAILKKTALVVFLLLLCVAMAATWYVRGKRVQRDGLVHLSGMTAAVEVRYDERGVPHIRASNETDLYRALGYVHAQDRLFQMEMLRRLARGELAEILGPKLLEVDRLFRTLGLAEHAQKYAAKLDLNRPASRALLAYLDGVNQYQASHAAPVEFDLLQIPKRAFTVADTIAASGYTAYSFAAAFRTEPALSKIRDQLGPQYLHVFDLDWHPQGVFVGAPAAPKLAAADWHSLSRIAQVSQTAIADLGLPQFEGSNAWVVSGARTASGKPLLAGDPHIAYSAPAVWYEAQLQAPGFELYGHFQALNPLALLGHNQQFGWSLTMFQNDDVDLIAEKVNPAQPNQVWYHGQWVEMSSREEEIKVKGQASVKLHLRRTPHGPVITDAFPESYGTTPVAMWWAFLETENPVLDAFYDLNRADTLDKARAAARLIHAPGLNVVWANARGDIGWWAAAKLVRRPPEVNPAFILDGSTGAADKNGFYDFAANPQEENPARGYIVSANSQPVSAHGIVIPGYYNLADRARRLDHLLNQTGVKWDTTNSQAIALDVETDYAQRVLQPLLPILRAGLQAPADLRLLDILSKWDHRFTRESIAPSLFAQMLYQIANNAFADELGPVEFKNLLRTRVLDEAIVRLLADEQSPWWDDTRTPARESRADILLAAWHDSIAHLQQVAGKDSDDWAWGKLHTLTHNHPLGQQKPLDRLFNIGSFAVPGGREVPNNLSGPIAPAPWPVVYGPSTRRLIDFAAPGSALGINPVGQSGVLFDEHYNDQAAAFAAGRYVNEHLLEADVRAHTRQTLILQAP
ncbi:MULTISPECIES: penicillin acylase family protein [unclassified Undibacterium]|uniref:penicillin acylase family protein n=1 Tax=unclassified Undibacterium TaxID=2630295 RepID=UPI002AC9A975|nr:MULTISPECIES: penicillin acylase family protein [unclassified Undibacterium]MEB0137762.1 penicillin acylase family protein [Undibacterium sp. CCC2.1]MEB0174024.1 penicillin acylase family protein [Undibacterium sp. CCC1.1]MEB0177980.1 penicillin acylase family protein [Undibacterium sp. CCC3.4]MEB0217217.1 penicillin acylase family protein [Undibacterium sp. 5I2]WPX42337.1 penicillin acylase family protein [Undibacterium sp. CCC3.4]